MKKLIVILMILIVGILACGCTSQSTAPATTVTTAVPTVVPTTELPTAVPTTEVIEVPTTVVTTVETTATPTPTPTPLPDKTVIVTSSHSISPSTITIPAGTKVIFTTDSLGSTFQVAIRKSTGGDNIAESGLITTKKSWSYTFKTPGKYVASDVLAPKNPEIIIVT